MLLLRAQSLHHPPSLSISQRPPSCLCLTLIFMQELQQSLGVLRTSPQPRQARGLGKDETKTSGFEHLNGMEGQPLNRGRLAKGLWGHSTHKAKFLLTLKARTGTCHSHRLSWAIRQGEHSLTCARSPSHSSEQCCNGWVIPSGISALLHDITPMQC